MQTDVTQIQEYLNGMLENLTRVDLNPIDEANGYKTGLDITSWSVQELSARLNKPGTLIRQRLALLNLREDIQRMVMHGHLKVEYAACMTDLDHNFQSTALQYLTLREGKRMGVNEFRAVCARLYADQAQQSMFSMEDYADLANRRDAAQDEQKSKRFIPVDSRLPELQTAPTIGLAIEKYIAQLLQSDNADQILAASVVGTLYTGLLKHGLCKQPDQSPLDNINQ